MKLIKLGNFWSLTIDDDEVEEFIHMVNSAKFNHFTRDLRNEIKRVIG
jgi:hypothetical protein